MSGHVYTLQKDAPADDVEFECDDRAASTSKLKFRIQCELWGVVKHSRSRACAQFSLHALLIPKRCSSVRCLATPRDSFDSEGAVQAAQSRNVQHACIPSADIVADAEEYMNLCSLS